MSRIRTAVVNKETNEVVAIFDSYAKAKKETTGHKELKLVKEGSEAAAGVVFPPQEEKVVTPKAQKSTKGKPTHITIRGGLSGPYTWAGSPRNRTLPDDPRADFLNALATSSTFEEYFEAAPKDKVAVTSSRGNAKADTALGYAKYAIRCGWVLVDGFDRKANIKAAAEAKAAETVEAENASEASEASEV